MSENALAGAQMLIASGPTRTAATISYREATEEDADELVAAINAAYRPTDHLSGWTHEGGLVSGTRIERVQLLQMLRSESSHLIVAEDSGNIVGCVEVQRREPDAYIGTLTVLPAKQNTGLGKALLHEAESFAGRCCGVNRLVMVVVSARTELIDFYLRRGYTRTGEIMSYPIDAGVGIPKTPDLTIERLVKLVDPDAASIPVIVEPPL